MRKQQGIQRSNNVSNNFRPQELIQTKSRRKGAPANNVQINPRNLSRALMLKRVNKKRKR
jgi:hypothetical protein